MLLLKGKDHYLIDSLLEFKIRCLFFYYCCPMHFNNIYFGIIIEDQFRENFSLFFFHL